MCDTETRAPIDGYVIAIDETDHYTIDEGDAPYIASIRAVYLFNRNERTNVCELTPSYWLIHLYDEVLLSDDGNSLSDAEIEAIREKYENYCGDCIYVHCRTIDKIIEQNDQNRIYHYGDTELSYDECDYDEQMQQLEEHFHANWAF